MPVRVIGLSGPVKRTGPPLRTNAVSPGGPQTGVRCVRDRTPLNRPAPSRFEEEGAGGLRGSRDLPTKAAKAAAAQEAKGFPMHDGAAGAESFEGLGRDQTIAYSGRAPSMRSFTSEPVVINR